MVQRYSKPPGWLPPHQRHRAVTAPITQVPKESSAKDHLTSSRYGRPLGYLPPHLSHKQQLSDLNQQGQEQPDPESPDPESSGEPPSGMFNDIDESYSAFRASSYARNHPELREALQALLDARPEWVQPSKLVPQEEVEIRHEYAKKIEKRIYEVKKDFVMNTVQLVTILIVPMHSLTRGGYLSHHQDPKDLLRRMRLFLPLVKRYTRDQLTMPESTTDGSTAASTSVQSKKRKARSKNYNVQKRARNASTKTPSRKSRSSRPADQSWKPQTGHGNQKDLARQRDNLRCIWAKTAEVDVAHIIPQTWNDTEENFERTLLVILVAAAFLKPEVWEEFGALFADKDNLKSSDKFWNMLCLNKQLHWYLDHGFLGLKCLGIEPCQIKDSRKNNESDDTSDNDSSSDSEALYPVIIQFNWLKRNQYNEKDNKDQVRNVNLHGDNNDFEAMVKDLNEFEKARRPSHVKDGKGIYATVRVDNNTPLYSGHITRVKMTKSDAEKCQVMLTLAWALGVIAALTGAADWADLPPESDNSDGDEVPTTHTVEDWVRDQQERHQSRQPPEQDEKEERARRQAPVTFPTEPHEPVLALRPITNRPRDESPGKLSERAQTQTEGPTGAQTEAQAQGQVRGSESRTVTRVARDENVRPRYEP